MPFAADTAMSKFLVVALILLTHILRRDIT